MTFKDILDQAIDMLRRRGRLTYGALKRQFNLDDAYLEDLKDELIYGQQVARDENDRVLIWTGVVLSAPEPPASRSQPPPQATPHEARPALPEVFTPVPPPEADWATISRVPSRTHC